MFPLLSFTAITASPSSIKYSFCMASSFWRTSSAFASVGNAITTRSLICSAPLVERENPLPIVLHADHCPVFLLCLIVERLGEGAHLAVGQALRWAIGIFTGCIVVQDEHHQPRSIAGTGVFQHF